jgi:predicted nucleic acid-binding Zn ribbon protein
MIYCPNCGKKLNGDPEICDSCGELLSQGKKINRGSKISTAIGIGLVAIIIVIMIFTWNSGNQVIKFLPILILLFLLAVFGVGSIRKKFDALIIRISSGNLSLKQCPECENYVANANYCLKCGYELQNVYGYWAVDGYSSTNKYRVELNRDFIRVFEVYAYEGEERYPGEGYYLKYIKNPEIAPCTKNHKMTCLVFDYDTEKPEICVNQDMIEVLKEMFPDLNEPENR